MRKPAHRWRTRRHEAVRWPAPPGGRWADDARAEAFALRFAEGGAAELVCGVEVQRVDAAAWAADPDLGHAIGAWLVARGVRRMRVVDERDRVLAERPVGPRDLGDAPRGDAVRRLVTISPSNAEAVHALGAFPRVVACDDAADHPPEVRGLERLGPDLAVDLARIRELAPDLVVSSLTVPGMERNVVGLRALGVPQRVTAPRGLADVLGDLSRLGDLLDAAPRAAALRAAMEREIARLEAARPVRPARVYLEWWPRPMFTPGRDCYSNALIELAGGVNVFRDRPGASVEVRPEELVAADPDLCFVSWCGVAEAKLDPRRLAGREGLAALRAAREGRVHPLAETFVGRPGPRMLEGARRMADRLAGLRTA